MPNEWISVKDRLPDKNGRCLCYVKRLYESHYEILAFAPNLEKIDKHDFRNVKRGGWYDYVEGYGYMEIRNITHWMPLPQPPKGE